MPRSPSILQDQLPYHIGGRCINRDWFQLPLPLVWEIMCDQLHFIHHAFDVRILGFVLMSNHFHLIAWTPNSNLSTAMRWFMRETSRSLTLAGNRINQTYGGRHFRCVLDSNHYYLTVYKYVYLNPVRAGICSRAEEYPFSSLGGLLGMRKLAIPIEEDVTLFNDVEGTLNWLNQVPSRDNWESVRKALRRKNFALARVNRQPHPLENDVL